MKRAKAKIAPPPTIERAIDCVQAIADRSMLVQEPYAYHIPGIGWVIGSVASGGAFPDNASHFYRVAVLPKRYFS